MEHGCGDADEHDDRRDQVPDGEMGPHHRAECSDECAAPNAVSGRAEQRFSGMTPLRVQARRPGRYRELPGVPCSPGWFTAHVTIR